MIEAFELIRDPHNSGCISLKKTCVSANELNKSKNYVTELNSETLPQEITEAKFSNYHIQAFPELRGLEQLSLVDLRWNDISTFSFHDLPTNIVVLDLAHNCLREIPCLAACLSLKELNLSHNGITTFTSSDLPPKVQKLDLSRNRIEDIPCLETCTNLKDLNLGGNGIKTFRCGDLPPEIQILHLYSNKIASLPCLVNYTSLTKLYVSHNNIRSFSSSDLPAQLQLLYVSHNNITDIPCLLACASLIDVNLSVNFIRNVKEDIFPDSIEEICLQNNHINYIEALPPNVRVINLLNNPVQAFGKRSFPNESTFEGVRNGLSGVQKEALLQPLPEDLTLGYDHVIANSDFTNYDASEAKANVICTAKGTSEEEIVQLIASQSNCENINFSDNELKDVDNLLASLALKPAYLKLKCLLLTNNRLRSIDGSLIPDTTEVLWLDQNHLEEVPLLSDKKNLVNLNLGENKLSSIAVANFPAGIESLNLSGNNITTTPDISPFTSLKELNLSYNKIRQIPDAASVLNNPSLQQLSLDNNKLVDAPVLIQNKSLKVIDLSYNLLRDIPSLLFPVSVETILLQYNQLEAVPNLSGCTLLKHLILTSNQISYAEEEWIPTSIEELCINNNNLDHVPSLRDYRKLRLLNVEGNKISTIKGLPSEIEELYFSTNPVTVLCKDCFPNESVYNVVSQGLRNTCKIIKESLSYKSQLVIPPFDVFHIGFSAVLIFFSEKGSITIDSQCYVSNSRNRFVVVGDTEAGKSSLVTSLMNRGPVLIALADRTQVVDMLMWHITENDIYQIFDQGGHPIYSITNPLFMSRDSSILVVQNIMQQQPKARINFALTHTDCLGATECKERNASFQASVKAFVRDEINSLTIMLQNMKQRQQRTISLDFADKTAVDLLLSYKSKLSNMKFFPVSSRSFKGIDTLWQYLADEAKANRRVIPDKWVKLFTLMTDKPKYLYEYKALEHMFKELYGVMRKLMEKASISAELKECLKYFNDSGLVIWTQEDPVLCDYIFHNLIFLVSVLKSLFHHNLESMLDYHTVPKLQQAFSKDELEMVMSLYQNEGLLSHKLMSYLLQQYQINTQEMSAILRLLESFKFCYKISIVEENSLYFFPWFVQTSDPPPTSMSSGARNTVSLIFECAFLSKIPINVFERLCVKLQELAVNNHYLGDRYAWKNGFRVTLNRCECQIERQEDSSALLFSVQCPVEDLQEGWQHLTFLQKLVQTVLEMFGGVLKSFYVTCTHCTLKGICPAHRRSQAEVWSKLKHKSRFVRCPFEPGENIPSPLLVALPKISGSSLKEAARYVEENWTDQTDGPQMPVQQKSILRKQKAKLCLTMHVQPVIDILFTKGDLSNAQKLELGSFLRHQQITYLVDSVMTRGCTALDALKFALQESSFYVNQMLSKVIGCTDYEEGVFLTDYEIKYLQQNFYQAFMEYSDVEELIGPLLSDGTLDAYHCDELATKPTVRQKASYLLDCVLFRGIYDTVQRFRNVLLATNQVHLATILPCRTSSSSGSIDVGGPKSEQMSPPPTPAKLTSADSCQTDKTNEQPQCAAHSEPISQRQCAAHSEPISQPQCAAHSEPTSQPQCAAHSEPTSQPQFAAHLEPTSSGDRSTKDKLSEVYPQPTSRPVVPPKPISLKAGHDQTVTCVKSPKTEHRGRSKGGEILSNVRPEAVTRPAVPPKPSFPRAGHDKTSASE